MIENPTQLLERVEADIAADRLIQGEYWNRQKGCFVGCLRHGRDHSDGGPLDMPEWAWRLCDRLHEGCDASRIADNYRNIVIAVINAQIPSHDHPRWTEVYHDLMLRIQRRNRGRLSRLDVVDTLKEQCIKTLDLVIAYHDDPNRTDDMRKTAKTLARAASSAATAEAVATAMWSAAAASAALSAEWSAAAASAARSAEWSAALSAEWSAALSAESAATAASAARKVESQLIVDDLIMALRRETPKGQGVFDF